MLFKKKNDVLINTSKMNASEIIEVYARLNLFQKAALLRLLVRDVIFEHGEEQISGLQFNDIEVDGAIITARSEG
jgi:hypothetical protein